jgi:hypothetical protein
MRDELNPANSIDLDGTERLLGDGVDAQDGRACLRNTQRRDWLWRLIKFAGVVLIALAITLAFIQLNKKPPGSKSSSGDGAPGIEPRGQLTIPLHPSHHAT